MYHFIRKVLFRFPPETAHTISMNALKFGCKMGCKKLLQKSFAPKISTPLSKNILGISFPNPVGLGAGFDKNAKYLNELEALGFGFVEIGTVTPLPQDGNPKPRLFRLPVDKALINRMGFNNEGVEKVVERLKEWRTKNSSLIIGGNIGKNKVTPNEEAWKDYEICFKALHDYVDYFVVNVSSPNTPGLRELQEKESLRKILQHLQMINNGKAKAKPIFLKIAPDLTLDQIDDVIALALEIRLDGLVATNTTIDRADLETPQEEIEKIGAGGLSGAPVFHESTEIVRYIKQQTGNAISIIGSGGIFTGKQAYKKMEAGADLVQVWTGFIYEGPTLVKKICDYLVSDKKEE